MRLSGISAALWVTGLLTVAAPPHLLAATRTGLESARKLASELRYEEAVVDYERYLSERELPARDKAQALLELGFIYSVLGDKVSAERRGAEALEADPNLRPAPAAAPRERAFFEETHAQFASRVRLEVLPSGERPSVIQVALTDPNGRARDVLLRHAISPRGPFYSQRMTCAALRCTAEIPAPAGAARYTSWYYAEANDAAGNTLARAASPAAPLQVSVTENPAWYTSPWVWAGGAAVVVGLASVVYLTTPNH